MSELKKSRTAQRVHVAKFKFNFDDTMKNSAGATVDFGKTQLSSVAFDIIGLPRNSIVVGGSVAVSTAFDTAGYDVLLGDSAVTNRYIASTDMKGLGNTAIVPTGFVNKDALPVRLTFSSDDVCTAGVATVFVEYVIDGQADEVTVGPA